MDRSRELLYTRELRARAAYNGYKRGQHREKDERRCKGLDPVPSVLRNRDNTVHRYVKYVLSILDPSRTIELNFLST